MMTIWAVCSVPLARPSPALAMESVVARDPDALHFLARPPSALPLALPGCSGLARRHWSCIRRAQAGRFHEWCCERGVDLLKDRLPYGFVNGHFRELEVGRQLQCVDYAASPRACARTPEVRRATAWQEAERTRAHGILPPEEGERTSPPYCARHYVFDSLIVVSGKTAARITHGQLLAQARLLREAMMRAVVRRGVRSQFPRMGRQWLVLWRK